MRILRLLVLAAACLATVFLLLLFVGISLFVLPIIRVEAETEPRAWLELGFWRLVWISLPLWLATIWLTALGFLVQLGPRGRFARRALWIGSGLLAASALVLAFDILGFGSAIMGV